MPYTNANLIRHRKKQTIFLIKNLTRCHSTRNLASLSSTSCLDIRISLTLFFELPIRWKNWTVLLPFLYSKSGLLFWTSINITEKSQKSQLKISRKESCSMERRLREAISETEAINQRGPEGERVLWWQSLDIETWHHLWRSQFQSDYYRKESVLNSITSFPAFFINLLSLFEEFLLWFIEKKGVV